MAELQKTNLFVTATYNNGDILKKDQKVPAVVAIRDIPKAAKFLELNLRIVVDKRDAEELLEGILRGKTYLNIEQMVPAVER